MKTYIALLRGINVGGHKKILMADLRELMGSLNLHQVKTYIQSGNVVFNSEEELDFEEKIGKAIVSKYGWNVPILVKNASEMVKIIENCSFSEEKLEKSYFIVLKSKPTLQRTKETQAFSNSEEEFYVYDDCVYVFYAKGAGKAKMGVNFFEKKLAVEATARNYRTMLKLIEMAS